MYECGPVDTDVAGRGSADNPASNAVSRKNGYLNDGAARVVRGGAAATQNRYRMTQERWEEVRARNARLLGAPVTVEGVAGLRDPLSPPAN